MSRGCWIARETGERRFVPSERFPKCCDPAQRSSSSSEPHPKAGSRQMFASPCPQIFVPGMRAPLKRVLRQVRQRNATAHPPKLAAVRKTPGAGLPLLNRHRDDKHCHQVLPMIQSRTVETRWASTANSPRPCAGAMKDSNGSRPPMSRRSCGNPLRRLRGSLHRYPRESLLRPLSESHHQAILRPVVQKPGSLRTQTKLPCLKRISKILMESFQGLRNNRARPAGELAGSNPFFSYMDWILHPGRGLPPGVSSVAPVNMGVTQERIRLLRAGSGTYLG